MPRPIITASIDVTKIDKNLLIEGRKGKYLDMAFFEKPDAERGNDGFVKQGTSKEKRDAGANGPIIGNWRYQAQQQTAPRQQKRPVDTHAQRPPADLDDDPDSVPF